MPANTKQMAYILLLTVILMWCGLYAAYHNMQKATLWPDDGFFVFNLRDGALHMKLLGLHLVVSIDYMKDFFMNFLNKR